jgi:hypothetical protein
VGNPFITKCAFRDKFGYRFKRLHWAWHRQWWLAFAVKEKARHAAQMLGQPCFVTQADVDWGKRIAKERGLM